MSKDSIDINITEILLRYWFQTEEIVASQESYTSTQDGFEDRRRSSSLDDASSALMDSSEDDDDDDDDEDEDEDIEVDVGKLQTLLSKFCCIINFR